MIKFDSVTKKYKESKVLDNLTFEITDNDFVLLVGHNGSGKSTTINLILGNKMLDRKDSGVITNDFKRISYFPEKFILPSLIKSHDFIKTYFEGIMNDREINSYLDRYNVLNKRICNLSKGMAQKLIIVKSVMEDSDLYIFDEPLNGLDDESRGVFLSDLERLYSSGRTIIISTHEPEFFMNLNTKIIRLGDDNEKC